MYLHHYIADYNDIVYSYVHVLFTFKDSSLWLLIVLIIEVSS